jgi:hypothetical protein
MVQISSVGFLPLLIWTRYFRLGHELAVKWEHYARTNEVVHPDKPVAYGKPVSLGKY